MLPDTRTGLNHNQDEWSVQTMVTSYTTRLSRNSGLNSFRMKASLLALFFLLVGCGSQLSQMNPVNPPSVQAQTPTPPPTPNSVFVGRYLFHSHGATLFESGYIIADGKGHFTLHSMFIDSNQNNSVNTAGHYSLNSALAGTANQGQCSMNVPRCEPGDDEAIFVSSDGNHAMMVSMEGPGVQWSLEMDRDQGVSVGDLSNCDATSGSVLGCNDGWVYPTNWK